MTAAIWAQSRLIISYTVVYRPFYGSWDDEFTSAIQPSHRVAGTWLWSSSCYTGGSNSRCCELWQLCTLPTKFHTFAASHATNHLDYDHIHGIWMDSFPFALWKHGPNAAHRCAQRQRGGVQPVPSFHEKPSHAQRQHGTAPATEAGGRKGQGGQCFCSTTGVGWEQGYGCAFKHHFLNVVYCWICFSVCLLVDI